MGTDELRICKQDDLDLPELIRLVFGRGGGVAAYIVPPLCECVFWNKCMFIDHFSLPVHARIVRHRAAIQGFGYAHMALNPRCLHDVADDFSRGLYR